MIHRYQLVLSSELFYSHSLTTKPKDSLIYEDEETDIDWKLVRLTDGDGICRECLEYEWLVSYLDDNGGGNRQPLVIDESHTSTKCGNESKEIQEPTKR